MKILDAIWFNEMGKKEPIGIVIGEDEITGEKKAYIGVGAGFEEGSDVISISERGAKVSPQILKFILKKLEGNNKEKKI